MKNFLVELIGVFFLVLTIGCTVILNGGSPFAPIAIGLALMIMVYAGGYISGGHYNPAVSTGAAIRGSLKFAQLIPYCAAQFLGAALGALAIIYLTNDQSFADPYQDINLKLILSEFLFTFALVYVVLHTATSKRTANNSYYGLAIGSTVTTGILAVGTLCLTAFNPAVALFFGIVGLASWGVVLTTIGINLVAGVFAAIVYRITAPKSEFDSCEE